MSVIDDHGQWQNISTKAKKEADEIPADSAPGLHDEDRMSEVTRDEIKLYLETARAEARGSAAEIAKSQAELRADLKVGMGEFSVEIANLKGDFNAAIATQTKWIAAMVFAALAAGVALYGIIKPSAPVQTAPAPTVILAQPYAPTGAQPSTLPSSQPATAVRDGATASPAATSSQR